MTIKQVRLLALILAIAASPLFALAERAEAPANKRIIREKMMRADQREIKKEFLDAKRPTSTKASSTKPFASSTPEQRTAKQAQATRIATLVGAKTEREIAQVKSIIDRMTGPNSILLKLEAAGANTTAIKAKLDEARALANKAQAELNAVKNATSTPFSTSTPVTKAKMTAARTAYSKANMNVKLAISKIKEARRLIAQIPGIGKIEKETKATSTRATSTKATSTKAASTGATSTAR